MWTAQNPYSAFTSENFKHALSKNFKNFFLKVKGAEREYPEFYY